MEIELQKEDLNSILYIISKLTMTIRDILMVLCLSIFTQATLMVEFSVSNFHVFIRITARNISNL